MKFHTNDITREQGVLGTKTGDVIVRLWLFFLAPLAAVITTVTCLLIYELYSHEQEEIRLEVVRVQTSLQKMFQVDLAHDAGKLRATMDVLHYIPALNQALAGKDRARLLTLSAPVLKELRPHLNITHFYFTGPDRVNLLRVHQPNRYGDLINRYTTLEAERTGALTYGVELGQLGTFALRLVEPWYAPGSSRPIGYVELGMEIDHILQDMQDFLGAQVFVLISKEFLQRDDWENGMKMLGRVATWDRFPDVVLSAQSSQALPSAVAAKITEGQLATNAVLEVEQDSLSYRLVLAPLQDASGRTVGQMAALVDVSYRVNKARQAIWLGAALTLAAAGMLFTIFYWLVNRVGRRIKDDEQKLEALATHDDLTGLCNRREFQRQLDEEVSRHIRYFRTFSLLMLDIDHFKAVNDIHGHLAGDAVLKGVGKLLTRQARAIDRVCRYGGEEITVILPETNGDAAVNIAERLRSAVEREGFDIGDGQIIHITLSVGVASWPEHGTNADALIAASDAALYAAKQSGRNRVRSYELNMAATSD